MELKTNSIYQQYICQVTSQIKSKEIQLEIMLELEHHILDIVEEYITLGREETQAVKGAIVRMGNPETVGRELSKVHQPRPEWGILSLTGLLAVVGLAVLFSMDLGQAIATPNSMLGSSFLFYILGFALAAVVFYWDYRKLETLSKHLYWGVILFLLIFSYISSGSLGLNKILRFGIEISPILLTISLAGIYNDWKWDQTKHFLLGIGVVMFPLVMLISHASTPMALLFAAVSLTLMIFSGAKSTHVLTLAGLSAVGVYFLVPTYKWARLESIFDPSSSMSFGWIYSQLENLRSSAGLFGQGVIREELLVPMLHTELTLSYIIYSFGWVAAIILLCIIGGLLVRMAGVSLRVQNRYGKLLLISITSIFTFRFLWNILMNLGLFPIAAIGLPFISYGRVDLITNMLLIGFVLSIYRRRSLACPAGISTERN